MIKKSTSYLAVEAIHIDKGDCTICHIGRWNNVKTRISNLNF